MLISRETDYAIRLLRVLADQQNHTVSDISKTELIPLPFAYQILRKLTAEHYVRTTRGKNGGTVLTCDLTSKTLLDLIMVIDGDMQINECTEEGYTCAWCQSHGRCRAHELLCVLQNDFYERLDSISLAELVSS